MIDASTPRLAGASDVHAIAAIANAWIDATPWMPRVHAPEAILCMVRDALPKRELWVIGDPIEGYLSLDPAKDRIAGFYCTRTGAGLGKKLMDRAKSGRRFLTLNTHAPNVAARRFYRREGFVEVARADPAPPETVPEIVMEWRA